VHAHVEDRLFAFIAIEKMIRGQEEWAMCPILDFPLAIESLGQLLDRNRLKRLAIEYTNRKAVRDAEAQGCRISFFEPVAAASPPARALARARDVRVRANRSVLPVRWYGTAHASTKRRHGEFLSVVGSFFCVYVFRYVLLFILLSIFLMCWRLLSVFASLTFDCAILTSLFSVRFMCTGKRTNERVSYRRSIQRQSACLWT
jgi:hypothetical protein